MDLIKFTSCTLCGDDHLETIFKARDRHYGIKGEYTIDKCQNCGLVFLNPMPTEEYLTTLYPESYYAYQSFPDEKPSFLKRFAKKYLVKTGTKDPKFDSPGKILDIGCGSGLFLNKMKQEGWEVYGVEVSESAAKIGNEMGELNIHPGDLMSIKYQSDFFDYIRLNHSFEHIPNPNEVLKEIYRILKPDGKLFIGVPNIDSFNAKLFKQYWWYLCAPVHTFNYSVSTLSKMMEKHGFAIEKVQYNGNYGGILGSFQIYLNRNTKRLAEGFFLRNGFLIVLTNQFARLFNFLKINDVMEIIGTKKK